MKIEYWFYYTGCFLLGLGGTLLWGLKAMPFIIGLLLIISISPALPKKSKLIRT